MKIESVRDLKRSLPGLLRKSLAPRAVRALALNVVSARAVSASNSRPVVALGISHSRGLRKAPRKSKMPQTIDGVPIVSEVVGTIRPRSRRGPGTSE